MSEQVEKNVRVGMKRKNEGHICATRLTMLYIPYIAWLSLAGDGGTDITDVFESRFVSRAWKGSDSSGNCWRASSCSPYGVVVSSESSSIGLLGRL